MISNAPTLVAMKTFIHPPLIIHGTVDLLEYQVSKSGKDLFFFGLFVCLFSVGSLLLGLVG